MNGIDPIMLGHNQFIGVSHLSQDAARSRVERFSDMKKVGEVIKACLELGVKGMMLSTHPKARDILDYIKAEGLAGEMSFYPLIPYAQGYVRMMNAVGVRGLLKDILGRARVSQLAGMSLRGAAGFVRRDYTRLLGTFIDIELLPFNDFNVKAVFIHDAFVDLGVALGAGEQFRFYVDHIAKNHGAVPGFETMNFARLVRSFDDWGIKRPLVMAPFNKVGFQMNPSREECERALRDYDPQVVAMSTLAAGYLHPREAYEYLFSLPNICSVIVGVSTREHAVETFGIIGEFRKRAA